MATWNSEETANAIKKKAGLTYKPEIYSPDQLLNLSGGVAGGWSLSQKSTESITGVDTTNNTFDVAGDVTGTFVADYTFEVTGSTGNDGKYTVTGSTYDGSTYTTISVSENVSDSTADGSIEHAHEWYFNLPSPKPSTIVYKNTQKSEGTLGSLAFLEWGYGDNDSLGYDTVYVNHSGYDPDSVDATDWQFRIWHTDVGAGTDHFEAAYPESIFLDPSVRQGFVVSGRQIRSNDETITIRFRARTANGSSSGDITIHSLNRAIGAGIESDEGSLPYDTISVTGGWQKFEITYNVSDMEAGVDDFWEILLNRSIEDSVASSLVIDYRSIEVEHA